MAATTRAGRAREAARERRQLLRDLDIWIANFRAWREAGQPAIELTGEETNWRIGVLVKARHWIAG